MLRFTSFLFGFVLTLVILVGGTVLFIGSTAPKTYNVLFVGSDQRGTERARSDVLFIVAFPKSATALPYFLSIPRDTKIEHEEYGLQKITHFYALGDRPDDGKQLGNIALTTSVVEDLLDVTVDATVEVTFSSFESIIDNLGGAIVDGAAVSGKDALAIVRDRFTGERSDFDRQSDAREIVRSLLTKIKEPLRARNMLATMQDDSQARVQYSRTRLIRFLIGAGVSRRGHITLGEMEEASLPGHGDRVYTPDFGKELYYWVLDEEATQRLVEEHF